MSMGSMSGGRGKRRPMAEINMTPLVDVMLVLLVIFMVTAPMLDKTGVDVQLPKADGSKTGTGSAAIPWSLTIDTTGHVYISGKKLEPADVQSQLPPLLKGHEKDILTINGDGRLSYETVMKVVAIIHKSGVDKIKFGVQGMKP